MSPFLNTLHLDFLASGQLLPVLSACGSGPKGSQLLLTVRKKQLATGVKKVVDFPLNFCFIVFFLTVCCAASLLSRVVKIARLDGHTCALNNNAGVFPWRQTGKPEVERNKAKIRNRKL